jgi:hypothetical protein
MENQNQLTDLEKHIYNKHLAVSKTEKNKPFKLKRDFSDVVNTEKHKFLKRISTLFAKHPDLDQDLFFKSPYKLYPDVAYFGLDYFSTMRAVRSYTIYKKQLLLQDPDTQLDFVKESLRFISNFCVQNKIYLHQYPYHRNSDIYTWMQHYKENKISIYSVMEFSDIYSNLRSLSEDVQKFFVSDFVAQFQNIQSIYNNSKHLKSFIQKALPILSNFVNTQLTSNSK